MDAQNRFFQPKTTLNVKGQLLDLSSPLVMGILNITPDSFFDGGKFLEEDHFLQQTEKMLEEGATIIDIGAASSRPGAAEVSEEEELQRLIPVVKSIHQHFPDTILSVDTYRSCVAEESVSVGATIINDISGGTFDPDMFATVARLQTPYVLMHMQGSPQTMQKDPVYENVTLEVFDFFQTQVSKLKKLGVTDIVLDPGFGFGKTIDHNYQLLRELKHFNLLELPILAGVSRKSMINKVLGTKAAEALNGTSVVNTLALMEGASILRVHDVKEACEAIKIVNYYKNR